MAKRTLNIITGNQGSGKTDKMIPISRAKVIFALERMREEVKEHWKNLQIQENFSGAFKQAEDIHKRYYPDDKPLALGQWKNEYAAIFTGASLNQRGVVCLEFSHRGEPKFFSVALFKQFDEIPPDMCLLAETRNSINMHMLSILKHIEEKMLFFIKESEIKISGRSIMMDESENIDIDYRHSHISFDKNILILGDGTTYDCVEIGYKTENNKLKPTKVDEFANLIGKLFSPDEISKLSFDTLLHDCAERLKKAIAAREISPTDFKKVVMQAHPHRLTITRNTAGDAKKRYLARQE